MVSLRQPYSNATKREFLRLASSSANGTELNKQTIGRKGRKKVQDIIAQPEV
ncbi:hypothetical protein COCC4DRAFT_30285, partial [Bipolaris maydis ATCC 48331]